MDALLTSLNLAVQQGIDPDPDNAVAVATFAYQDAAGHPQQVCLFWLCHGPDLCWPLACCNSSPLINMARTAEECRS